MSDGDKTPTGFWVEIVPPPHEHTFPTDLTGIGVGSIWECTCKVQFTYTGETFQEIVK